MNKILLSINSYLSILFTTIIFSGCGGTTDITTTTAQNSNTKVYHSENSFSKYANKINPDLIFEYRFDECSINSKIKDSSQNGLHGTPHNRKFSTTSILNRANQFSEDGYIQLPTIKNSFENGLTLSSWVDFGELDYQDRHFIEISNGRDKEGKARDFISFWQGGDKNRIRFQLLNGNCNTQIWTDAIQDGLHHYSATYDHKSGEAKIYLDGIEQPTYDTNGNPSDHLDQSCIDTSILTRDTNILGGTIWNEFDNGFSGILDETKLFDRPLTPQEIETIYQNELNGKNYDSTDRLPIECNIETIERPIFTGEFQDIKELINDSKNGIITDVTYICVGDSTRADDGQHGGQYLYYQLRDTLKKYNVSSHLVAKSGHTIRDFAGNIFTPNWKDAVNLIPNNGEHTIVDISLGINDVWNPNTQNKIGMNLEIAINKIRSYKPMTIFVLTMPNRQYDDDDFTQIIRSAYIQTSIELNIPLINVIDSLMPTQEKTSYDWYKKDGYNVHLTREGQRVVADFILKNILP
jgi:lysophospholipase L1-like esterase